MKTHLLIIDPQNDFCDPKGALYVDGAVQDMEIRLPTFVEQHWTALDQIHVTLDSHHPVHIAHPIFWANERGERPTPFTVISVEDVKKKKWFTFDRRLQDYALSYVNNLAEGGKFPLVIWPPHCLIGTWGHNVVPRLSQAINSWESVRCLNVNYIHKGSNMLTEHYSAIEADVKVESDPSTSLNIDLLAKLNTAKTILVAGEASSHCVANTVRDIVKNVPTMIKKIVLLEDAMSPVRGFEAAGRTFLEEMKALGVRTSTTTTWEQYAE
jgi:nicotinamidase/pyrazinamidase